MLMKEESPRFGLEFLELAHKLQVLHRLCSSLFILFRRVALHLVEALSCAEFNAHGAPHQEVWLFYQYLVQGLASLMRIIEVPWASFFIVGGEI